MKMRGAASSPSALCWRISRARLVSLPTSRMVVMPQASYLLSSYSSGCGLPPRSSCRWACALISPGRTYLPVASITASASAPPRAGIREPRAAATGSSGITSAIVLFSMTMSLGPLAGVPLPSTTMALWISRRRTRLPLAGAWAAAEQARESAARETSRVRDMGTIVGCYGEGEQSTGLRLDPAARRQGGGSRDGEQPAGAGTTREGTRGRPRQHHMGDGPRGLLDRAGRIAWPQAAHLPHLARRGDCHHYPDRGHVDRQRHEPLHCGAHCQPGHQYVRATPIPMGTGLRFLPQRTAAQPADSRGRLRVSAGQPAGVSTNRRHGPTQPQTTGAP